MSDVWGPGVILIAVIAIIMAVPCVGVALLGSKMINKLAFFPSKTPAIQKSILIKLIVIELISVALLLAFFHALSDYGQGAKAISYYATCYT